VILIADELAQWFNSFTRYQAGEQASNAQQWLSLYDGKALVYDRQTGSKPQVMVRHAAVCVTGGIQPHTLKKSLGRDAYETGLAPRLLLGVLNDDPPHYSRAELPDGIRAAYAALCRNLFSLKPFNDTRAAWTPNVVKLSPEADALWVETFERWRERMFGGDDSERSAVAKLQSTPLRIALVLHVAAAVHEGRNHLDDIAPATVESASRITDWFWRAMQRFAVLRQESDSETDQRRLVEMIGRRPCRAITVRELMTLCRSSYPSAAAAREALDGLVAAKLGEWRARPPGANGGAPTREFALYPL
jgi:hypothetical protein